MISSSSNIIRNRFIRFICNLKIRLKIFPSTPRARRERYYPIIHFNNFNLPVNGGYFTAGSNQVGVFITDFL
jgi:hypothetical protein